MNSIWNMMRLVEVLINLLTFPAPPRPGSSSGIVFEAQQAFDQAVLRAVVQAPTPYQRPLQLPPALARRQFARLPGARERSGRYCQPTSSDSLRRSRWWR